MYMITWHCYRICNHIDTLYHSVPGKCPYTSFQEVNVAASIQTYGNYVLGKCQNRDVCLLRTVKAASADDCAEAWKMLVFSSYH